MKWTGERLVTDPTLGKGVIEHLHRYAITLEFVNGKKVVDIASGEGYGTNLIAQSAEYVLGVDISPEAIEHANQKYKQHNIEFLQGSATNIPCEASSIDVVVSFETLEHHDQHDKMMEEIKRILKVDGLLIISTPERDNYRKVDPGNHFHIKELTGDEFSVLLTRYFSSIEMYHQNYVHASFISPVHIPGSKEVIEYKGDFDNVETKNFSKNNIFNIAICSNGQLPAGVGQSFFNGEENLRIFYGAILERNCMEYAKQLRNTMSYKLGNTLVRPLSFIKKLLKKFRL